MDVGTPSVHTIQAYVGPLLESYIFYELKGAQGQCKIDTIITASPEYLDHLSSKQVRCYFERALDFFKAEVGKENIFSTVVHLDERNLHMHLRFVPLTKDDRLSA